MLDPALLATFVTVARVASFSAAARRLGVSQSTVSEQIRRLEQQVSRRLFVRDTHRVALTADGVAMESFARAILDTNEDARRYFAASGQRQRLRLGASENFVQSCLPAVLEEFQARSPAIDLEVTVGLSNALVARLDAGELDLVLGKRRPGETRGQVILRDEMVWIGRADFRQEETVPLVMYPEPSLSRAMAIEALDRGRVPWRIFCTCDGLSGLRAAAMGGFGLMVQPRRMIPAGLVEIPSSPSLPAPGVVEFVAIGPNRTLRGAVADLVAAVLDRAP
jgi:DNA-binding transcriptional LysR family regulator